MDEELFTPDNPKASDYFEKGSVDDPPSMIGEEAVNVNDGKEALRRFEELPRIVPRPRTSAAKCREVLEQIKNMTYIVEAWENGEILERLREKLEDCLHLLHMTAPKENGVILEAPKSRSNATRKRKLGKKQTKLDFKNLPEAKKKNPYAGRSGERAHQMKRSFNVSLLDIEGRPAKRAKLSKGDEDSPKIPNMKIDATKVPYVTSARGNPPDGKATTPKTPDNKAATPETPNVKTGTNNTPDVKAATANIPGVKSTKTPDVKAATIQIPDDKEATPNNPDVKAHATASTNISMTESDCEVTLVGRTTVGAPKNSRFLLAEQHLKFITSGGWLTDHIIGAAHSVLRSQFPHTKK